MELGFEVFAFTVGETDLEIEVGLSRTTNGDTYSLRTVEGATTTRHAVWTTPPTCSCPDAGSTIQIELPKIRGIPEEIPQRPVTMQVVFGAAEEDRCASATVSFPDWPYRTPITNQPLWDEEAAAAMEPLVEALCVAIP